MDNNNNFWINFWKEHSKLAINKDNQSQVLRTNNKKPLDKIFETLKKTNMKSGKVTDASQKVIALGFVVDAVFKPEPPPLLLGPEFHHPPVVDLQSFLSLLMKRLCVFKVPDDFHGISPELVFGIKKGPVL